MSAIRGLINAVRALIEAESEDEAYLEIGAKGRRVEYAERHVEEAFALAVREALHRPTTPTQSEGKNDA